MRIAIIGAGPAGLLLALYLSIREVPYYIDVYERRPDIHKQLPSEARTFSLTLLSRGIRALKKVPGLFEAVENSSVKVNGQCIHIGKKITTSSFGNFSLLDRKNLLNVLLVELEKVNGKNPMSKISLHFNTEVSKVDFSRKTIYTTKAEGNETTAHYDCLVACDGSRSVIRRLLADEGKLWFTERLTHGGYKSIYLATSSSSYQALQEDKGHRWMAGEYSVRGHILQPGLLWGVLTFPSGKDPLKELKEPSDVYDFFRSKKLFEVAELLPEEEAKALISRSGSNLVSIKTDRLHVGDSVLLLGDAAHAMSASLGQGCNSALEDVRIFGDLLDTDEDNWSKALRKFTKVRLNDTHAIVEMSHYSNPRTPWMWAEFNLRMILRRVLPTCLSKYLERVPAEALMNGGDRPYSEALVECRWWIERVKASCPDQTNGAAAICERI